MKLSNAGRQLIKELEGHSLVSYKDAVGLWTIGVGHLLKVGDVNLKKVLGYFVQRLDNIQLTDEEVDKLLELDLEVFVQGVNDLLEVYVDQCEFDALISLAFNIGLAGLKRSSVLRKLNEGIESDLSKYFMLWNKATMDGRVVELKGLTRRRTIESLIFHNSFNTQLPEVHNYNINLYSHDGGVS